MNSITVGTRPRRIVLLLALACLLALPSVASAGDKGALIAVNIAGNVNDTDQKRIIESVEAALKSGETPTIMGLAASLKRIDTVAPEVAGCFTSKCLERIGSALETSVGYVVTVKEDFEFYAVEVAAYDLTTGKPLTNTTGDCEICTADEAIDTVTAAAGKATLGWTYPAAVVAAVDPVKKDPDPVKKDPDPVKKDPDPVKKDDSAVRVAFYSNPADSFIYVDGQKVGQGSFVGSLEAGPHKLKFERKGYNTAEETVDLRAGDGPTYLVIHLRASDGGEQVVVGGRTGGAIDDSNQMGLAWGFTGGGVLLTVTGAILLAIDGEPTCSGDDVSACPDVFSTRAGGGIALGLGVASLTTGVIFFLWDELAGTNSAADDDSVSFGIDVLPDAKGDVGGGAVTFGGRF